MDLDELISMFLDTDPDEAAELIYIQNIMDLCDPDNPQGLCADCPAEKLCHG